jgi:hypothetical protein
MGLKVEPGYIGQTGYLHPVELDRNLLEGLFQRSGGVRYGDLAISQGVGTRAIAVASGRYFILGQENAQQGGYFVWSDAVETFLLAAAVGNPRIDTLLVRVIDDQYGSISGAPRAEFAVVQGVASGSPTARPDSDFNVGGSFYIPGGWARLGDVRVNVADTGSIPTGQITTRNRYVRPPSGYVICNSTDRPSDPVIGDRIHELDTDFRRMWTGTFWRQIEAWSSTVEIGADAAQIDITNIPPTLRRLDVRWGIRSMTVADSQFLLCRVNNASANHFYSNNIMQNVSNNPSTNVQGNNNFSVGLVPGTTAPTNFIGSGHMRVAGWHAPGSNKPHFVWQSGMYGTTTTTTYNEYGQGTYGGAGPFTSLRFLMLAGANIKANSWVSVEGWE